MKIKKLFLLILAAAILLSSSAFTGVTYAKTKTDGNNVVTGAPIQKVWTFTANKSGTVKIVFTYSRPWEKDTADMKTVKYTVIITDEKSADPAAAALTPDKENTVKTGQKFTVTLEENASTGFSWSYQIENNTISLVDTETEPVEGAPVQKMWTFTANKSGTYKITYTYSRSWEKDTSDSKTAIYKIKVLKKNGSKSDAVTLTSDKINTVYKNQKFFVILKENASTGYSWSYKTNSKTIILNKEETINDTIGAPEQKMWTFKADKSGTVKIVFTYCQPWDKGTADIKTAEYTVKVLDEKSTDTSSIALIENKENIVKLGQKFFVSLKENTSTGYSWSYDIEDDAITLVQ